jgi:hypothetical protein
VASFGASKVKVDTAVSSASALEVVAPISASDSCHPAKEEGIGLLEVLGVVTVQFFVRKYGTMIAAPVQCDVDGIPKGSHNVFLKRANVKDSMRRAPPCNDFALQARDGGAEHAA